MIRWIALLLVAGCVETTLIQPGGTGSRMRVCPSPIKLEPIGTDTTSAFPVYVTGQDTLVGLRWLPAQASRLDVDVTSVGERYIDQDGDTFNLRYAMFEGTAPDTASPRDDGVLEFFFRETSRVSVWVEVLRGEELNTWRTQPTAAELCAPQDPTEDPDASPDRHP